MENRTVQTHITSFREIAARAVVERALQDASLKAKLADRRFATAYDAALQLSRIATPARATASKPAAVIARKHLKPSDWRSPRRKRKTLQIILIYAGENVAILIMMLPESSPKPIPMNCRRKPGSFEL